MSYNSKILDRYLNYYDMVETGLLNEYNRNSTILEMSFLKYNQMIDDINTKLYIESGTFEDADYLYQEAEEQATKEQVGPIKTIINAVSRFLTMILNKIKAFIGILPEEKITVEKTDVENLNLIQKHIAGFKEGVDKIKQKDFLGGAASIGRAAIPELLAVGAVAGTVILSKQKLDDDCNIVSTVAINLLDIVKKIENFMNSNPITSAILSSFQTAIDKLKSFATSISQTVTRLIAGVGKNNENIDVTKLKDAGTGAPVKGNDQNQPTNNAPKSQPQENNSGNVEYPPAVVGKKEVVPVDKNKTSGSNNPNPTPPANGNKNQTPPQNNKGKGGGKASVHDIQNNKQLPPPSASPAVVNQNPKPPKSGGGQAQIPQNKKNKGLPGPGQTSSNGAPYKAPKRKQKQMVAAASYNDYDYDSDSFFENYDNDYTNYDDSYDRYNSYYENYGDNYYNDDYENYDNYEENYYDDSYDNYDSYYEGYEDNYDNDDSYDDYDNDYSEYDF